MVSCVLSLGWNGTGLGFSFVGESRGVTSLEGGVRRGSFDGESLSWTSLEDDPIFLPLVGEDESWASILLGGSLHASASS